MRTLTWYAFLPLALLAATAAPASGQEASQPLPMPEGAWSLAFSLPSGGGASLGVWKLVGPRTNLGLDVGLRSVSTSDNLRFDDGRPSQEVKSSDLGIAIEPSIRQYITSYETLAPYIHGNLLFAYSEIDAETVSQQATTVRKTYEYGIGVGIGVEWAPLERFSVGGHTGIRFIYLDRSSVDSSPAGTAVQDGSATIFDTFVSSLVIQLYF